MSVKNVFLVDVGVILPDDHKEISFYNGVYDQKRGYYDENQFYADDLKSAIATAEDYVNGGVDGTYGIVSETTLPEDDDINDTPVSGEAYDVESIVFSAAKLKGKVVRKFIEGAKA